uniref:transposase n=1 Tax=unclassified Paraburkholderia TaxID=2615204 RepID=UPI002AB2B8BC
MNKQRRTFSPEFKQQAACLALDQGYSHMEASRSVGVSEAVLRRWVPQLQMERQRVTPQSKAITPVDILPALDLRSPPAGGKDG